MARTKMPSAPEVGGEAPEFMLSSAQGGQLRLSLRLDRGPVVVFFYRGLWSEECVEWVKALAAKEGEINLAGASLIGIGTVEPQESREFARQTGLQSYILYDYARVATHEYGLLEQDKEHGDFARPAAFLIKTGHEVVEAWVGERPSSEELLAKVTELTGLPKAEEEGEEGEEEKPRKRPRRAAKDSGEASASDEATGDQPAAEGGAAEGGEPKKLTREEREKRRAERKAARAKEGSGAADAEKPPTEAPAEEKAAPEETGGGEEKPST